MIIVTGASGTLGRALVARLQSHDVPFRAAYTSGERAAVARTTGIDAVVADYRRPDTLRAAFSGCTRLFLLGPNTPDQTALELAAVEAAVDVGARHVVKHSVMGAEADDYSLAHVHRPVERALEDCGLRWTFLRPNSFMQNVETFMAASIRDQGLFFSACGEARISHVDVRDLADVAFAALTQPGHDARAYTLTGAEAVTYDELAQMLAEARGLPVQHAALSHDVLLEGMLADGMPEVLAHRMLDLERYFREGRGSVVTDAVERVTGHTPRRIADYARACAAALRPVAAA